MAIRPPAAWTASVTRRWFATSAGRVEPGGARIDAPLAVGGHAPGDDQPGAVARAA